MSRRRRLKGARPALVIEDEVRQIPAAEPDTRRRILCAPNVFDRVNKAVEGAGQAGAFNVQRSLFVQPGQVYLTGADVPLPPAMPEWHRTVTEELEWIKSPKFVDPYAGKPNALGMLGWGP